jgi:hypothetical protein
MAVDLSGLQAEVTRNRSVDDSAAALINGIADRIATAIREDDLGDSTAINALVEDLRSSSDSLAGAVAANTPAAGGGGGETGGGTEG